MNSLALSYSEEIRDYLLGRADRRRTTGAIRPTTEQVAVGPLFDWWLFEGKRYRGLDGPLASHWDVTHRHARRLLASHSPYWRPLAVPEGEVDWLATAHQSLSSGRPEFVCRTSRLGLAADEASALRGWQAWIAHRWQQYARDLGLPEGAPDELPWGSDVDGGVDLGRIRRWAFIARRSRWPLLRSVVAECLRVAIEPQRVDQLPLPAEEHVLFELLCLVRILRALEPAPKCIRWLQYGSNQNTVRIPGVTAHFQYGLPREEVLATPEFAGGLREAMLRHGVRVPSRVDLLIRFDERRRGFDGILLEAKSGQLGPDAAVHQLKCYRAALRREFPGRLLVWGVVASGGELAWADHMLDGLGSDGDLWLFTPAHAVEGVVQRLFGEARAA